MWHNFYSDGGWGMYPTTLFGVLLLAVAVLVVLRPERRFVPILAALAVMTPAAGFLGTAVGLVNTFRYVQQVPLADQVRIAALGCAESLNDAILGLMITILAGLIASVAGLRSARTAPAPVLAA